jgi:aspartate 1-decarboxylase
MKIKRHSKITVRVEDANLHYEGSITIPKELMISNDIEELEQVHVLNKNNGERFITYAIGGDCVCLNGAAARLGEVGDEIIILTYEII